MFLVLVSLICSQPRSIQKKFGNTPKSPFRSSTSIQCDVCLQFVEFINYLLTDESSVNKISGYLRNNFCASAPRLYQTLCIQIFAENTASLASLLLDKINSLNICEAVGLCDPENRLKDDETCTSCHNSVKQMSLNMMNETYREMMYDSSVDFCNSQFSPPTSTLCVELMKISVPIFADLAHFELENVDFCSILKLCKSDANNKAAHIRKTRRMNELKSLPDDVNLCFICRNLTSGIKYYARDTNFQEITRDFVDNGVCNKLSALDYLACHAVVLTYVPALFDLANQTLSVTDVCAFSGMCTTPLDENNSQLKYRK